MDERSLATLYKQLADVRDSDEGVKEADQAERAYRLAQLIETDVWKLDLYPILRSLYDRYLESVKAKTMDPDTLKVFDDILSRIDSTIRVGAGAMERLAARRAKAADIQTKLNQQRASTPLAEF